VVEPEVSVIMPVRNGGRYLREAVASILSQTLGNLELLLVDDRSSDGAIGGLDMPDQRLKLMSTTGNGVVDAFNHGMRQAKGRYIARMDADDVALENRLQAQLSYLHSSPDIGISGACVEIFSEGGIEKGNRLYQEWLNSVRTPGEIRRQLFIESPVPNPTAVFRRDALLDLGGYRDTEWPEDYDLFLRADRAGIRMGKPDGILLRWREHGKSLTRTDERYSRANFQRAKAHFLAAGRLPPGPFLIWGAGSTGRQMYDLLLAEGREATGFIEVHPRRIGEEKRGKPIWDMKRPGDWPEAFILVAVGFKGARREIGQFLGSLGKEEGEDFLFVA
jgi:glycosyltransferase involved in cell wall biosynthesis